MADTRGGQDLNRDTNTWGKLKSGTGSVVSDSSGGAVKTRFGKFVPWKLEAQPMQMQQPSAGGMPMQGMQGMGGGSPNEPAVTQPFNPAMLSGQELHQGGETIPTVEQGDAMLHPGGEGGATWTDENGYPHNAEWPVGDQEQQRQDEPYLQRRPEGNEEQFWQEIEKKMQDPQTLLKLKSMLARMEAPQRSRVPGIMGSANLPRFGG